MDGDESTGIYVFIFTMGKNCMRNDDETYYRLRIPVYLKTAGKQLYDLFLKSLLVQKPVYL